MKKNVVFMTLSLMVIFLVYTAAELIIPLPLGNKSIEFQIKHGATFREVVNALAEKGLVRDKWVVHLLGRVTGVDRKIKAGYYPLWGTMSPLQIFNAIRLGKIIEYEITIVPGDSLREIALKFSSAGAISVPEFQQLSVNRDFLDSLDIDAPSLEGYLYPDTYRFPKGLDMKEVLSITVDRLREEYDDDIIARIMEMDISEREMLTMASIVEKEAITDQERPIIAAVYYNRIRRNMRLQADPTAVYGLKSSSEKITRDDLLRRTPYNTYLIKGLPPGPIGSPGLKSIEAALNPADVPFLYFVSNNDGTHKFSVTLSNHLEAVREYRNKMKRKGEG